MKQKVLFDALHYSYDEVVELSVRQINAAFRVVDESKKWPICGRFNATERAIRRIRKFRQATGTCNGGLEYCLALEREIADIVNDPRL